MKKKWFKYLGFWALIPFIVFTIACGGGSEADADDEEEGSTNNFPQAEIEN